MTSEVSVRCCFRASLQKRCFETTNCHARVTLDTTPAVTSTGCAAIPDSVGR